jgi:hypothetical protein
MDWENDRWPMLQREVDLAKKHYLADYETLYLERDQVRV